MRQAFRAKNLLYALGLGGFLGALAACSSFVHGYTAGEYAYRMLPAAVGPGAYRLHLETSHDRVLRAYVQDHGTPDYLYVIDEAKIHLVYVRDDMLVTFTRGWTADGTPSVQRPIPTAMMAEIAETDRRLILASRGELRPETPSTSREAEAQPPSAAATGASEYSIGTCFAISDEGRLVTAAHVVEGSSELVVRLSDGRALPATVERLSTPTDLALLHVDAKPPAYLSPGPAGSVHIGDRVFRQCQAACVK